MQPVKTPWEHRVPARLLLPVSAKLALPCTKVALASGEGEMQLYKESDESPLGKRLFAVYRSNLNLKTETASELASEAVSNQNLWLRGLDLNQSLWVMRGKPTPEQIE